MSDYTSVQSWFYKAIVAGAKQAIGSAANMPDLKALELGSSDGFAWCWDLQPDTNKLTYELMNRAVSYQANNDSVVAASSSITDVALATYRSHPSRLSDLANKVQPCSTTSAHDTAKAGKHSGQPMELVGNENGGVGLTDRLIDAIEAPSCSNGAIGVKDAINGGTDTLPAWTIPQTTSDLQSALDGATSVTVTLRGTRETETAVNVSVNDSIGCVVPSDFVSFFGNESARYSAFSQQGTGSSVEIELVYTGVGVVNFAPMPWNPFTLKGWYAHAALDSTRARSRDAGYISALVFSNPPNVKMTYADGNYGSFKSAFKQESSWGVSLFGIKQFSGKQSYERAFLKDESGSGRFSISFPPKSITSGGECVASQLAAILAVNVQWIDLDNS